MSFNPVNLGNRIHESTFRSGPSTGILPYRFVILDNVATTAAGNSALPPVKHPSTTFTSLETIIGVSVGPEVMAATASDGLKPATAWAAFTPTAQNKSVNVRISGTVPVLCDDSTDGTNILAGDYVRSSTSTNVSHSSQTTTMAGLAAKAARSTNTFSASQHIGGVAWTRVAPSADKARYVLIKIQPQDV